MLIIIFRGSENWSENSFSRLVGILKGPEALPEPNLEIMVVISSVVHGFSARLLAFCSFRYEWKGVLLLGIFFSIDGPILTKKLFIVCVMVLLSVMVRSSWINLLMLIEDFFDTFMRDHEFHPKFFLGCAGVHEKNLHNTFFCFSELE